MEKLELTYLGSYWARSGDLFYMRHADGREARVYVDSLGETWVDVRVIPFGGSFHSERVDAYRSFDRADAIAASLEAQGFGDRRIATGAHRVAQRDL